MNKKLIIFLLIYSAFYSTSEADIIFVDTNNSVEEYNTINTQAKIRGEKVVIIPARTAEQQIQLNKLHQYETELAVVNRTLNYNYATWKNLEIKYGTLSNSPNLNPKLIDDTRVQMLSWQDKYFKEQNRIEPQVDAINQKIYDLPKPEVTNAEFKKTIASYEGKSSHISTIIFSGHHDSRSFTGFLGTVDKDEITTTMKNHPDVTKYVKTVMGLGCYTETLEQVQGWWKETFPNYSLIAGYDGMAPGAEMKAGTDFLGAILAQDPALIKISEDKLTEHNVKLISQMAHALPGFNIANSALCTRDVYVGMNSGSIDLTARYKSCTQENLGKLKTANERFLKIYKSTEDDAENIPCDGAHSWLRKLYSDVRQSQQCGREDAGPLHSEFAEIGSKADQMIRLIDFEQVYKNFNEFFKVKIEKLNEVARDCDITIPNLNAELKCAAPPAQNAATPKLSRHEILSWFNSLSSTSCIAAKNKDPLKSFPMNNSFIIDELKKNAAILLNALNDVPLSWVNPPTPGTKLAAPDNLYLLDDGG